MPKCAIVCCILLVIFVTTRDATFVGQCAAGDQHERGAENVSDCNLKHGKDRIESIKGFFSQEDASKALKIPGQQPDFGAKRPWPEILQQLQPGRKLIYLIRHGEAVSNAVQAAVGELAWMSVATACYWTNETSGEAVRLFDPDLTERGRNQAKSLGAALEKGDVTLHDLTGGRGFKVVFSPLSRSIGCSPSTPVSVWHNLFASVLSCGFQEVLYRHNGQATA